jgi:hypothetical protein
MIDFRLERGNPDDLEGRVTVYSIFQNRDGMDARILAAYLSQSKEDVSEVTGIGMGDLDDMGGTITGSNADWSFIHKDLADEGALPEEGDRLFVGMYSDNRRCFNEIQAGMQHYIDNYDEQQVNAQGQPAPKALSYRKVPREQLGDYIYQNFIVPMADANTAGDMEKRLELARDFLAFSMGSRFYQMADGLCNELFRSDINRNLLLLRVQEMAAVNMEDYTTAAKLRNMIKSMS